MVLPTLFTHLSCEAACDLIRFPWLFWEHPAMDTCIGRFGDRRLQKGGPFCNVVLWKLGAVGCVFGGLAAIVRAKSG